MFYYRDGQLVCEDTPLAAVAAAVGTPVYVYSQATLLERARAYQTAVAGSPAALVCYAVKANGNPELLRFFGQIGLGADVTSGGELFLARQAGIVPGRIIFSGVGKTTAEIETALAAGIRALHVESEMELAAVAAIARQMQRVAPIGVRVNPDIHVETHPYISTGEHAHKFGVTPGQARQMLRQAAEDPWLKPVGLAAHIGSQITELEPFAQSARFLVNMAKELAVNGVKLSYLDVGGGLGIDYSGLGAPDVEEWVAAVLEPVAGAGYSVVMEPGRSLVGPAGALLTQVLYTKQQGDKRFVIADAGMSDLIRPALYNAYHPLLPVEQYLVNSEQWTGGSEQHSVNSEQLTVDVVGPICETGDWLARERDLPPLEPGALLAILQAGAYGFAMSSNYNGRLKPAEVLVEGDNFRLIRQRQSYEHLLDGMVGESKQWAVGSQQ